MSSKGIVPGSNPSVDQMYSLVSDPQVKEVSQRLNEELSKNGIDINDFKGLMSFNDEGNEQN